MSAITKNYKVEFINFNSSYAFLSFIDITPFVVSLDDFVLQSTGKISTAKFTLNAEFGDFITNNNEGATPLIKQFDLVRISIIGDDIGALKESQSKIFEITTDLAQNASQSSYLLPLEAEGRERNLSGIPFGGFFRSDTHDEMATRIISANAEQLNPLSLQPTFVKSPDGDIPDFNPNIWDFTQVDNCYDAFLELLESLNLPVSAGGGGNRYAMIFEDDYSIPLTEPNLPIVFVKIVKQGSVGTISTIQQNDAFPIISIDKIKQSSTGTLVVARGRPKTSLQPQNYPIFTSRLEFYRGIKQYDNSIDYPEDSFVSLGANVGGWPQRYQANTDTTAGDAPPSASWDAIDVGDFIGILQYSPFTVDKEGPIKNGFANPDGPFDPDVTGAISIPDHNLVINDVRGTDVNDKIGTYRNWVYFRTRSPSFADLDTNQREYLKFNPNNSEFGWYDGFTVLVDTSLGALQGVFAGSDSNGVPFADNMAIFRATPGIPILEAGSTFAGDWFVIRKHEDFDQCAIYDEAKIYEFNVSFTGLQVGYRYPGDDRKRGGTGSFAWRSIANTFLGNECFHTPFSVANVTGLVTSTLPDGEPLNDPNGDPYNENSAIEIVFGYNQATETQNERDVWFKFIKQIFTTGSVITDFVINLGVTTFQTFTTPNYTNMGWWFVWPSPFPFSTHNGITEQVGDLFGGTALTINNHRYFDLFNIQYTTTGSQGWTHPDSSDLSEITGVEFLFNFDITVGGNRVPFNGDIPFAYWCIDKFGTVWKSQKKMYRHMGETQSIAIEFGDLSPVFRGRTPLGIDNVLENIIVGEVEVNEVFFKENVIIQGFQCETPYDEFGRYSPNLFEQIIKPVFFDIFSGGNSDVRFIGIIDAYGFTKTPVAISAQNALSLQRTIIPQFEDYQNIVNIEQLQRFADAKSQVEQFQYEQYTITQGGIADVDLENTITLFDPFLINDADAGPNTRNLAIREIHYSVPKDKALVRKIVGVKVIE